MAAGVVSLSSLARSSPGAYMRVTSRGRRQTPPHIQKLNELLVQVKKRKLKRVLIAFPPRHGKTEAVSRYFPCDWLTEWPSDRVGLISYEQRLAASHSEFARDHYKEWGPKLIGVGVSPATAARDYWATTKGGECYATGIGGALTGKGFNLLIVDDPLKNAEEARSETIREGVWEWFNSTAYTRLEPDGVCIVIQTRWHDEDLIGKLLALNPELPEDERWHLFSFPAIAQEDDVLGRAPGEALWPERYPLKRLEAIRRQIGAYWWSALFQQEPVEGDGDLFRREFFRYFREHRGYLVCDDRKVFDPRNLSTFQTVDLATSEKTSADWFVIETWSRAIDSARLFLRDVYREHVSGPNQVPALWQAWDKWKPDIIAMESVAFQLSAVQNALAAGLPVMGVQPRGDKWGRAQGIAARYQAGEVYHDAIAEWKGAYETELLRFPRGKNDDQVDAASYAGGILLPTLAYGAAGGEDADIIGRVR